MARPCNRSPAERRFRVLLSAYACLPGEGSETGIGWNIAREMAKYHDVWVLTRGKFRNMIEAELARRPIPGVTFVYLEMPRWPPNAVAAQVRYYLWHVAAYFFARRLHRRIGFDLAHHVSYVRVWSPSLLSLLPIPFVWGPVGGGETVARPFRRDLGPRARVEETLRDAVLGLARFDPLLRSTARNSAIVLANSRETAVRAAALGARRIEIQGESGVDEAALAPATSGRPPGPVRFVTLTRLVYWKGVHLGLRAFARLDGADATYEVVGGGPEAPRLRALADSLGLGNRVAFRSGLSREEWLRTLREADALVHPCLCNSGSMISLEAMAACRPVICLDRGGISDQVTTETGFKVSADTPAEAVAGLAAAMESVIGNPARAAAMGRQGRERVERLYSWKARGRELARVYEEAVGAREERRSPADDVAQLVGVR